jgi:hypothetical protein
VARAAGADNTTAQAPAARNLNRLNNRIVPAIPFDLIELNSVHLPAMM